MPGADVAAQAWARITVRHLAQEAMMRRSPDGGHNFPRCSSSGYSYEVAITEALPSRPTAIHTIDVHAAPPAGRVLFVDLDVSKVPPWYAADRAAYVARVAEAIVALVVGCGGRALVDVSPSGGRHVYILFAELIPHPELRRVLRALQERYGKVVDTMPMEGTSGVIRGPGSPHKSVGGQLTGFMELTVSVEEAEAICADRCGPEVWERLQVELAAELDALSGGHQGSRAWEQRWEPTHPDAPGEAAPLDTDGLPYLPQGGGRSRRIGAVLEQVARTGVWDPARYPSPSEPRQAVLSSAAACGWRLEDVRAALATDWAAISDWWRDEALLVFEWEKKAIPFASQLPGRRQVLLEMSSWQEVGKPVLQIPTRGSVITRGAAPACTTPPAATTAPPRSAQADTDQDLYTVKGHTLFGLKVRAQEWSYTVYQRIRVWQQAMRIVERLLELEWGERALTRRAVLRAVGAAAQKTGSMTIEFGTRSLAYATGLDHTTVAQALRELREGPLALIDLVCEAKGVRGDTYSLVIPDQIAAEAYWRRWRPGRIEAIHPAFRVLGRPAAFAYEVLSDLELSTREVETAGLLARSSTYQALRTLAQHGLAERGPSGGWVRGRADLDDVAEATGAGELAAAHLARIQDERDQWHEWLGIAAALVDIDPLSQTPAGVPDPDDQDLHDPPAEASAAAAEHAPDQRPSAPSPTRWPRSGRRRAPDWLRPPSSRRLITEATLLWDAEALEVVAEIAELLPSLSWPPAVPADVAAAIAVDHAAAADDDAQLALEYADYQAELAELHAAAHAPAVVSDEADIGA